MTATASKRLQMLEKVIAAGTDDPFVYYARALEIRGAGELDKALEALAAVEQRFPDYVPTFLMAGQVAAALGKTDDARGYLERGVALASRVGDEHARTELAQALETL